MKRDPLHNLLNEAAAGAPQAPATVRIVAEARRRAQRRLARVSAGAGALAAAVLLLMWGRGALPSIEPAESPRPRLATTNQPPARPVSAADLDWQTRIVAAHLKAQADAERRLAAEQALAAAPPVVDERAELRQSIDETARLLVEIADKVYLDQKQVHSAAQTYARVVAAFPDSVWASVASARLEQIQGVN